MRKPYKRHDLVIAGRSISDWGLKVSDANVFDSPVRSQKEIVVPGRNGTLIIDNGSWKNIDIIYTCYFEKSNFAKSLADFQSYLGKLKGYQRIEDTIRLGEYRLANLSEMVSIKRDGAGYHSGVFDITFNCKPQCFLKSGEEPTTLLPMRAEGLTTIYSPKYMFPTWTEVVPVDAYRIGITLLSDSEISYKVRFYLDGDPEYVDTTEKTLTMGERVTEFNNNAIGWQVIFTKSASEPIENIQVRLDGHGAQIADNSRFDGILCESFKIENPTGFKCKPLIEVFGGIFTLREVRQTNGEYWYINSNDYSNLTNHAIIDCENEYMYYTDNDDIKHNITGYTTIEHRNNVDTLLPMSFPEFGEGETELVCYTTAQASQTVGMMIRIYPHWFTI